MTKPLLLCFIVALSFTGISFTGCVSNQSNSAPNQSSSKKLSERAQSDIKEGMTKNEVLQRWGNPDEWIKAVPGKGVMVVKSFGEPMGIKDDMPPNEAWLFEYQMPNEKKSCVLLTANSVGNVKDGTCTNMK